MSLGRLSTARVAKDGLELQCLGRIDQNSLELWRQEFNEQRPHEALGMRCPSELYQHSARRYRGGGPAIGLSADDHAPSQQKWQNQLGQQPTLCHFKLGRLVGGPPTHGSGST